MSLLEKAIVAGVLALVAIGGWWKLTAHYEAKGFASAQAEGRAVAEAQAERNRELQRASEKRYTVQAEVRDRFIVTTVKEFADATPSLAACPVGSVGVRLLNRASECARGDSAAACSPDLALPAAR